MPREKPAYRDNLELLSEKFPDKVMVTVAELKPVFGMDIWKKVNDVSVCTKCGISICNGKFVQFDRKIVNKLRKLAKK